MGRAAVMIAGAAIAVLFGFLLGALGVPPVVAAIVVIVALMFGPHLYSHYWLPYQLRAGMRRLVDPTAGPPVSAEPVEDGFPQRVMDTVASGSRSLADWLTDDFVMIDHKGRRHGAEHYLETQRALLVAFPDLNERVEALHADFDLPDVLWMRSTQFGHARRGALFEATVWSRLTLTRDRNHIREIAFEGVVHAE
jgi:hypothetical protein